MFMWIICKSKLYLYSRKIGERLQSGANKTKIVFFFCKTHALLEKNLLNPWGSALYFLIIYMGTKQKEVRQEIADYKFKLKFSERVRAYF